MRLYFGATGWRLGVIGVHADNIFDDCLAKLSGKALANTDRRYASLTDQPRALRFIDRLVADSRAVALNHTAGLSLPQQLQMTLFALAGLLDEDESYKGAAKRLIRRRHGLLFQALGVSPQITESDVDYYTLLDLEVIGRQLYGAKFAAWLLKREISIEFLFRLARETSVVLLPGKGFEDTHPSARVSLANLRENDYIAIGKCTRKVLDEYYQEWKSPKK
jgi:aspartate 4-decarboxylase